MDSFSSEAKRLLDVVLFQTATLEVFDISGRLVRTLVQDHLAAGDHTVAWNGADGQRRRAPAGVYF